MAPKHTPEEKAAHKAERKARHAARRAKYKAFKDKIDESKILETANVFLETSVADWGLRDNGAIIEDATDHVIDYLVEQLPINNMMLNAFVDTLLNFVRPFIKVFCMSAFENLKNKHKA